MASRWISEVLQHLRRMVLPENTARLDDSRLLADYLSRRDEAALASLVKRHGPMVWGVCYRILGNGHDAEDAFQATFLVFVRKATSIAAHASVGNWLYGVARKTALKARATAVKRQQRERPATPLPEPAAADQGRQADALRWLDEELSRLPQKYRAVILLCELEGRTRAEAARKLGLPEGTVASRLARARDMLAKRLARHGLPASSAALAAVWAQATASASVPAALVPQTIEAARTLAAGPVAGGVIAREVAVLTESVVRSMMLRKLRVLTLACSVVLVVGAGVGLLTRSHMLWAGPGQDRPPAPPAEAKPAVSAASTAQHGAQEAEKGKGPRGIMVWNMKKLHYMTASGKAITEMPVAKKEEYSLLQPIISPDRRRVAFMVSERPPFDREGNYQRHVQIRAAAGGGKPVRLDLKPENIAWTPSGKLLVVEVASRQDQKARKYTTALVDVATNKVERLQLPDGAQALAVMPGETALIAKTYDAKADKAYLDVIDRDGKVVRRLTEVIDRQIGLTSIFRAPKLAPDGSRLLFMDSDLKAKLEKGMPRLPRLYVYDLKANKRERLADVPVNAFILDYGWSPDSRRLAYAFKRVEPGVPLFNSSLKLNDPKRRTETESHVVVADADGKSATTVMTAKGASGPAVTISSLDWR